MLESLSQDAPAGTRKALRKQLLDARLRFVADPQAGTARDALGSRLIEVLLTLEPELLGVYWPLYAEFNAPMAIGGDATLAKLPMALPFSQRSPVELHYRRWDGNRPSARDDCGLPCSDGARVVPDVVLVPCLGYTGAKFRLGYGGGYFDRWLARNPGVTTVGIAWASADISGNDAFAPQPHDQPLSLIVTEREVI